MYGQNIQCIQITLHSYKRQCQINNTIMTRLTIRPASRLHSQSPFPAWAPSGPLYFNLIEKTNSEQFGTFTHWKSPESVLDGIQRCKIRGHKDKTYYHMFFRGFILLSVLALPEEPESCKQSSHLPHSLYQLSSSSPAGFVWLCWGLPKKRHRTPLSPSPPHSVFILQPDITEIERGRFFWQPMCGVLTPRSERKREGWRAGGR